MITPNDGRREQHEVLTVSEVASVLRVHVYTVHNLLKTGHLKGFKLRSRWRIHRKDLNEFMSSDSSEKET